MKKEPEIKYTENRIKLNPNTAFVRLMRGKSLLKKAGENAKSIAKDYHSYVGRCYNQDNEWIGYYIPR